MRKTLVWILTVVLVLAMLATPGLAASLAVGGIVVDPSGRPVEGAEVEVYALGSGLVALAKAGPDGRFKVDRLPDETSIWNLRAWAKGYRAAETGWFLAQQQTYQRIQLEPMNGWLHLVVKGRDEGLVEASVLVVGPDHQVVGEHTAAGGRLSLELPRGDYRLILTEPGYQTFSQKISIAPGGAHTLTAEMQPAPSVVTGEVRDAVSGQPVDGALVEMLRDGKEIIGSSRTDGKGRFSIGGPGGLAGSFRLRLSAPGYRTLLTDLINLSADPLLDFSGSRGLKLEPEAVTLTGLVLGSGGERRHDAVVTLHLQGHGEVLSTTADREGYFRLEGVPVGSGLKYRLTAQSGSEYTATDWMELKGGPQGDLVLKAGRESAYGLGSGTLSGRVTEPDGKPVAGARVEILRPGRSAEVTETDQSGQFIVRNLPGSRSAWLTSVPYTVRVSKEGYRPTREVTVGTAAVMEFHVDADSVTALQVTLRPLSRELRGRVVDDGGRPVARARVTLTGDDRKLAEAVTDGYGWYSLHLTETELVRSYYLDVAADGYLAVLGKDVTDQVRRGDSLEMVSLAQASAWVEGFVAGPGGSGVAGATVQVLGPTGELARGQTDSRGFYRIGMAKVTAATLVVSASLPGWTRSAVEVQAPAPGAAAKADLGIFPATAVVEGQVYQADGSPAPRVRVELLADGAGVIQSVRTDERGHYRMEGLDAAKLGWIWIRVLGAGDRPAGGLVDQLDFAPAVRLLIGEPTRIDVWLSP